MNAFGDRRENPRFDITGKCLVSLEVTAESRVRDISTIGALLDLPAGPLWASLRTITLTIRDASILGIVRRQMPVPADPDRQLVGVEFIQMSAAALVALQLLLREAAAE
jgi:hypothetical protein